MSRSVNNFYHPPQSCCPQPACPNSCPIICCTPPISYPYMPRVSRIQCRTASLPRSSPKPIKTMVYLQPCPRSPMPHPCPKVEVVSFPPPPPPPPPPPICFFMCTAKCVPRMPCPPPTVPPGPSSRALCISCPRC